MMLITTLSDLAKDNPLTVLGGLVAGIVVGVVAIDDRYAHAADVSAAKQSLGAQLEINRLSSEVSVLELRRAQLDDKLFEVDRSGNPDKAALHNRYATDLRDVTMQKRQKETLIAQAGPAQPQVDAQGNPVDAHGNPVDAQGNPINQNAGGV